MTTEELKRYKAQIEKLKQEFHDDSSENAEKLESGHSKHIEIFQKPKEGSLLSKLKSLDNSYVNPLEENNPNNIRDEKITQTETKEINKTSKIEIEFLKDEENKAENLINKNNSTTTTTSISSTTTKKMELENEKIIPSKVIKIKQNNNFGSPKSKVLKYLIALLILFIMGFIALRFHNKNTNKTIVNLPHVAFMEAYSDSILHQIAQEKTKQELEDQSLNYRASILIADTFQLIDPKNFPGYYLVIGSFTEIKNAKKMIAQNNTGFKATLFTEDKFRVALELSENKEELLNDIEAIRVFYPNAWLLYNKN